ncbi:MAG: sialate O-acetylesterase [Actinomycetota bacterium]
MNKSIYFILILATLCLSAETLLSQVKLPPHFSDHMVLQRNMKVPVWGTANPGESVTVTFAGQKKKVKAGLDGKWRIDLAPMPASAVSRTMTVSDGAQNQKVMFGDVLVGEVWLCSGQSNMDFTVAKTEKYYFAGVNNEAAEVAAANYPLIRRFTGNWKRSYEPKSEVEGTWKITNPENVREFSAIGYFFARDLQKEIKVPIGIITLTFGASTAQSWIRREALEANPELKPLLDKFDTEKKAYETDKAINEKYQEALKKWEADVATAKADGKTAPRKPRNPDPVDDQHNPTVMFNGMIAPMRPFAIRGVLWYQGESITGAKELFPKFNRTLITDWRKLWGEGEFPFYLVQLAANKDPKTEPGESSIALVREMQTESLALPNTEMAVTIDIGDAKDVHPHNKQDLGNRLAKIALAKIYGRKIEYSGPVYESMKIEGNAIRLKFSHADGGLIAKTGALKYFAIAGADRKFVWADAKIEGDTVIVSSSSVSTPIAVRYAWADNPEGCNLYNAAGLPAVPFRTDKF